jgi:D-glycero-beta-D-manno-heptose-7-phosphate kinase
VNAPTASHIKTAFQTRKVFLIGDAMIDAYMWGNSTRLSPEAPVPVIDVVKTESRPGGAANVAINLKALGAQLLLVTAIGDDANGARLKNLVAQEGLQTNGFFTAPNRVTSVKTRIISGEKHMLRVDEERIEPVTPETDFLKHITACFESQLFDVVIFQDYDKGVLTPNVIAHVTDLARSASIPIAVDPKKDHFFDYKHVTLFKPNLKELQAGLQVTIAPEQPGALEHAMATVQQRLQARLVLTTLSEHGVAILSDVFEKFPAHPRNIVDVSGAGDTVISVAALALACGYGPKTIAQLANLAGGLVCEFPGVVPIAPEDLFQNYEARFS